MTTRYFELAIATAIVFALLASILGIAVGYVLASQVGAIIP